MDQREPRDLALLLLRKAVQDEAVVRKFLDDPEVADEVVEYRYENWGGDEEPFDRQWSLKLISDLRQWADTVCDVMTRPRDKDE